MGQEVAGNWRTLRNVIIRSHPSRHDQRAREQGLGLGEIMNVMRCMCASSERRVRAKQKEGKRMTLRTECAGGECCGVDKGVKSGDEGWFGVEYEREGIERGVLT